MAVRLGYHAPDVWGALAIDDVGAAMLDGAVQVGDEAGLPLHHYPLEQTAAAHAAAEEGAVGVPRLAIAPRRRCWPTPHR